MLKSAPRQTQIVIAATPGKAKGDRLAAAADRFDTGK
jgi:hypothetical protein